MKVSTKTGITPVEQPFGFEVSLKKTVNTARHKINKTQTVGSPAK